MSSWGESFYYVITGAALLLSVMGVWFTALIPGLARWDKRFFLRYFIILLFCSVSALTELLLHDHPVPDALIYVLLLLETMLLSLPLPMQTVYLLHCCGKPTRSGRLLPIVIGLWAVFVVLLVSSPFISGFIYITPQNQYYRGPLYPLILAPMIAALLLNFAHTIRYRAQLSHKAFLSFVIAQVPMMATLTVNLFVDAVPFFDISFVLSALAMYSFILSDQIGQDRRQQQEIARQQREIARQQQEIAHKRASVMVLQMRPHFIYNTLMSIYSLCWLDPRKAQQVTMDFTNYLRSNFNAIASDGVIPFSTELEHTRAYLSVEQAQYNELLAVAYDTPFIHFRLPPLTLQPIVENAVKHGIDPDADPLQISIRTRHKDSCTRVIVEDNGPGVAPSVEDRAHTTLANIRQRLELMCGGSLSISSGDEGGTVVTMTIPDHAGEPSAPPAQ